MLYVQNTVLEFMFPFTYELRTTKTENRNKKNYTNCRPNANVCCVSAQVGPGLNSFNQYLCF